jgi:hypothetical protein
MAIFKRDDIVIKYGGDDSRFQKVNARVMTTGKRLKGFFADMGSSISSFFGRTLVGSIAAVGTAFTMLTRSALKTADGIAKTADKIGVGVEELQKLRYAASTAGVQQGVLDMALQRFSRRVGEAAQGTGVLYQELERLRIPLRDQDGTMRSLTDVLFDYADAVQQSGSAQERLRLAFKAFDSEGAVMVNLLARGSEGMRDLFARAEELGVVMGEDLVRQSEALNQAWEDFTTRVSVKFKKALLSAVGFFDKLAGNYRTVEDIQGRLSELDMLEARTLKERADAWKVFQPMYDRQLAAIREERQQLEGKKRTLEQIRALEASLRGQPTPSGTGDVRTGGRAAGAGGADDWRTRSPEEIGSALSDFRSGRINQWELAERAGLSPPGTADMIAKEQAAMVAGVPVTFSPGDFEARLREMANEMQPIPIKVKGELVWEDEISDRADQVGGRD